VALGLSMQQFNYYQGVCTLSAATLINVIWRSRTQAYLGTRSSMYYCISNCRVRLGLSPLARTYLFFEMAFWTRGARYLGRRLTLE
jgi:hypothetical protein